MKHNLLFPSVLCLVLGLLCGILIPISWDEPVTTPPSLTASQPKSFSDSSAPVPPEKLDPRDSFALLNSACLAVSAMKDQNYALLGTLVHPQKGVTFTPFSTVRPETDVTLSASQISQLASSKTIYVWGEQSGSGSLIEMTARDYFDRYVFDRDYTQSPRIGVDEILIGGNALENLTEAYPGCRFVDFTYPSRGHGGDNMNWTSLKLVFEPGAFQWYLTAIVHGQWTT